MNKAVKKLISRNKKSIKSIKSYLQEVKTNRRKRITFLTVLVFFIIAILVYRFIGLFVSATVNGSPIFRLQVVRELEKQGGSQVLDSLITKTLIFQEAKKARVNVEQGEITQKIGEIEKNLTDQGTNLDSILMFQNQTRSSFEEDIKIRLIIEKLFAEKLNVTDQDIKDYYDTNQALYEGKTLDEVSDEIRQQLIQEKLSTEYQKWIKEIKDASKINFLTVY